MNKIPLLRDSESLCSSCKNRDKERISRSHKDIQLETVKGSQLDAPENPILTAGKSIVGNTI